MGTDAPDSGSGSTPERVDVILPAGGRLPPAFAQQAGTEIKALLCFQGQTILHRTLLALRATRRVRRMVVVGGAEALSEARRCGADGAVTEGASMPENILCGLQWLQEQPGGTTARVLDVTTDLPLLTAEAVVAFLDSCPAAADVVVPIVTQAAFEARFPASDNVFVPLRDGAYTLGGTILFRAEALHTNRRRLEQMFAARKSQWRMVCLIGPRIAWRFATRQLTVEDIVNRAGQLMGCTGAAVDNAAPELAFDIDLPTEYTYACRLQAEDTAR
jgi:CTP:molybdopterin cytidylyltransferase MocA